MVKSEVSVKNELEFPKLMIYKDVLGQTIILSTGYNDEGDRLKGSIVFCNVGCEIDRLPIGTYRESFCVDSFKDYNGTVKLSN